MNEANVLAKKTVKKKLKFVINKLDNEVVGVIGMIAFTKNKNSFLNNQGNYEFCS